MKKDLNITQKGLEILEEKEVHLDTSNIESSWMEKYNLAKLYYQHYGNLEIPQKFKTKNGVDYDEEGVCLGAWILIQRQAFNGKNSLQLSSEQIKLLNEIGMRWDYINHKEKWMEKYNLAKAYYEHYGNLEVPSDFKTKNGVDKEEDGIKLGIWVYDLRQTLKGRRNHKISLEQIKLLDEIGMRWDNINYEEKWMEKYNLARTYYEYYGNLKVSLNFKTKNGVDYDEEGVFLRAWIDTQRQIFKGNIRNKKLSSEQIKLLEQIGVDFDYIVKKEKWMNKYYLAKLYYLHYGNLEVPSDFKTKNGVDYDEEGFGLGFWISAQRRAFNGKLSSEKIKLLNEIGMRWDYIIHKEKWMKKYNLAKAYYEYYGNLEVPFDFKTKNGVDKEEDGIKLGIWIYDLRQTLKGRRSCKISPEQIKLLDEIGMRWDNINYEEKWMKKYNLARAYYEHYGDSEIPQKFKTKNGVDYDEKGVSLGGWIDTQRQIIRGNIRNQKLSSEQIKLLEQIGIDFDYIGKKEKWMKKYNLARAYYEHYGDLEIPYEFKTKNGVNYDEEGVQLGRWIFYQRKAIKKKMLTSEQIKLFDEMGMRWDNIDKMDEWMEKYNLAQIYYEHYGNLEIPRTFKTINGIDYDEEGVHIGEWIGNQRGGIKGLNTCKVTSKQINLLNEIGMRWDSINKVDAWMSKYNLAKIYYEHYGNFEIPRTFKTINGIDYDEEGVQLGRWISTQSQKFKGKIDSKLTQEQIKLLEKIEMKWFSDNMDYRLQDETITDKNIRTKQIEIINRFYSVLNSFNEEELPTKEEFNNKILCKLNHKK